MPLDPSIPLSGRPPQIPDPFAKLGDLLQLQQMKAALEDRQADRQTAQAQQQQRAALEKLIDTATVTDPQTGMVTYDRAALQRGFGQLGIGSEWPKYAELLDKADGSLKAARQSQMAALKDLAAIVDISGNNPVVWERELKRAINNGLVSEAMAAPYMELAQNDPKAIEKITASLLGRQPAAPVQIETVDPEGRPQTTFVTPKPGESYPKPAPKPQTFPVTVNEGGRPVRKLFTAEELAKGVEEYRAPSAPKEVRRFWIMRNKKPVRITEDEYREGVDTPASTREQGRPLTSGDANTLAELDTALDDLNALSTTLSETATATGTVAEAGAMLPNAVTELTGWGEDSKKRQGVIDRVKQVIGKALEGGVLRKEDEYKYTKILPTIGDTQAVAESKINGLWAAIEKRRQTQIDALADAGYDVSKFAARPPRERQLPAPAATPPAPKKNPFKNN